MATKLELSRFWREVWAGAEREEDKLCVHNYAFDERLPADFLLGLERIPVDAGETQSRAIFEAFQRYAVDRQNVIRLRPYDTFCGAASNPSNLIDNDSDGIPELLVTVLNLAAMIRWAIKLGGKTLDGDSLEEIKRRLAFFGAGFTSLSSNPGSDALRERGAVIALYNAIAAHVPKHPVWVGAWDDFEALADWKAPGTWLEAVGLPVPVASEPLIVVRYRRRDAPAFIRPSQQEAGWFHLHFPSPPCHPLPQGGITMRVGSLSRERTAEDQRIVREFIHPQAPFVLDDKRLPAKAIPVEWVAEGWTPGSAGAEPISQVRTRHHGRLQRLYRVGVPEWMPNPMEL